MSEGSEATAGAAAPARVLVASYTLGGTTARLADRLGAVFGAEVLPIVEQRPRRLTPVGLVRSILDGARGRASAIEPLPVDPAAYDLVLVGGPCWAGGAAGPVLGFLARYHDRLGRVAGFATAGKAADQKVFERMERALGRPLADRLILSAGDLDGPTGTAAIEALADRWGVSGA